MKTWFLAPALAVGLSFSATPALANDSSGPALAVSMVGQFIAQQGNAALLQIRNELRRDLEDALRPLMPAPAAAPIQTADSASPTPTR